MCVAEFIFSLRYSLAFHSMRVTVIYHNARASVSKLTLAWEASHCVDCFCLDISLVSMHGVNPHCFEGIILTPALSIQTEENNNVRQDKDWTQSFESNYARIS